MSDTDLLIVPEPSGPSTSADVRGINVINRNVRFRILHPNGIIQKCLALLLMCLLGFGSYFCYDNPAALEDYFIKNMTLSTTEFVFLYSWYSWPNVILCFIGGFLMDKVFGIRLGTCIYALFVVIGQLIFAYGAYINLFSVVVLGRFIFGIGGESLAVAQNSYAVVWFKGDVLNMVFGFQLSIARAGSAVNFFLMEPLYKFLSNYYTGYQCLGLTLLVAGLSCIVSFISSIFLAWQDKYAEKILNRKQNQLNETVKLSDIKNFPLTFWLTIFIIVFYYSAIFSFVSLGKLFFETKFHMISSTANMVNSILYLISAFLSPFLGFLIDKLGKNVSVVFCSLLITVIGHIVLTLTQFNPIISMCYIGLSYSMIASALWPLIAFVTPEHLLGTAYGIAQSLENFGMCIIQIIAGIIVDKYGFLVLEGYFISCFCVALIFVIILWLYDLKHNGFLNMSSRQRKEFLERQALLLNNNEEDRLLN